MPNPAPFSIASVAKSLAELKAVPLDRQAMALLKRLAQLYPQHRNIGGLQKGNLLLPNDPYGLAFGYEVGESMPVRRHLLGAPWTRLVNEGFLVDPQGTGGFEPSEEGLAALDSPRVPVQRGSATYAVTAGPEGPPKVFISYSWDSEEHKTWVLNLATELRGAGIDIILDRWHLSPGSDRIRFMNTNIADSNYVVIVCTPNYVRKSVATSGGVAYEAMVITSELARDIEQKKFIPLLRSGEWNSSLPNWLQSKIGVDFRGDPYKPEEYHLLLATLHNANLPPPPLGPKPTFPDADSTVSTASTANAVEAALHSMADDAAVSRQASPSGPDLGQSPIAYAFYETKGAATQKTQAYVRPASATAESFKLQVSNGDSFQGSETEVAMRYIAFDFDLRQRGFVRMTSFNNGSRPLFKLPN